jgi:hypothetical protein
MQIFKDPWGERKGSHEVGVYILRQEKHITATHIVLARTMSHGHSYLKQSPKYVCKRRA